MTAASGLGAWGGIAVAGTAFGLLMTGLWLLGPTTKPEGRRKLFHVGAGLLALVLPSLMEFRRCAVVLRRSRPLPPPVPNEHCPICHRPIVVAATTFLGGPFCGPMMAPRPRQELIAACPEHGHSPFNDASVQAVTADSGEEPNTDS